MALKIKLSQTILALRFCRLPPFCGYPAVFTDKQKTDPHSRMLVGPLVARC